MNSVIRIGSAIILGVAIAASAWSAEGLASSRSERDRADSLRVEELIDILDDVYLAETNRSRVVAAIVELGEIRALAAAPALAEKLDFHRSGSGIMKSTESPSVAAAYPAVAALVQIGPQALPAIRAAVEFGARSETFMLNAEYTNRVISRDAGLDFVTLLPTP
jgi:hypothetical protein